MDPIANLRDTINKFKAPYLSEHLGGGQVGGKHSIQDVEEEMKDVRDHIDNLYQIITEVIRANGVIPSTDDITKKAVYSVFEKNGVFPALRADPSLKDKMLYYANLDMRTYPYTLNTGHITILAEKGVKPVDVIIPNKEVE
jgi:hypothetical protein